VPETTPSYTNSNRLLSHLSPDDFALLEPDLKRAVLPLRKQLEVPRRPVDQVYFPESSFVSVVADGGVARIEAGMIGREGMTGLPIVLGTDRSPNQTFVQNAGEGLRIATASLRRAMAQSSSLHHCLLRYAHTFVTQATQTARANARNTLEERLARWLLMAHDRLDTDDLIITHEFLSLMLGTRRPGVAVGLNFLEKDGLIRNHRGSICIIDRTGLKRAANGAYGVPEAEFERLFGRPDSAATRGREGGEAAVETRLAGSQQPEAARILATQLLLLRARQCGVCDAERKNESFRDWHLGRAVRCMILPRSRRTTHDRTRAAPNAPRSFGRLHRFQRYTYT
jgi:CRP-like cAMP-binding protein